MNVGCSEVYHLSECACEMGGFPELGKRVLHLWLAKGAEVKCLNHLTAVKCKVKFENMFIKKLELSVAFTQGLIVVIFVVMVTQS